ncbi:hypothetical protein [Paracoccus laeviglucosivorans]|uniref:Uncharacterized protein n=1 Tax=Paracoccus laeviglucosivorans TaxID=1197861 RepID=A0A521C896_9RHOB|nr:hypothetical protein [Paracoccus laeviglucosivorans]SMO55613.1 hypothetical protein SAMN06265221_10466 [Paracoccus laeviglucosivorans]
MSSKSQSAPVTEPSAMSKPRPLDRATEQLVERLRAARTANEMALIVGLKPIKGRSGPKIAY